MGCSCVRSKVRGLGVKLDGAVTVVGIGFFQEPGSGACHHVVCVLSGFCLGSCAEVSCGRSVASLFVDAALTSNALALADEARLPSAATRVCRSFCDGLCIRQASCDSWKLLVHTIVIGHWVRCAPYVCCNEALGSQLALGWVSRCVSLVTVADCTAWVV